VQACSLQPVLGKRVNQCSKGFRQRIGVAAALLHDPKVILLDEPTHGLDPLQVVAFSDFIRSLKPGRAILFSSHILNEVVTISDRVLMMNHGRLLADVPVGELQARAGQSGADVERVILDIVTAAHRRGPRERRQSVGGAVPGGRAHVAAREVGAFRVRGGICVRHRLRGAVQQHLRRLHRPRRVRGFFD
jgi:ABC-type multidrug transport system ATPase subunit